MTNDISFNAETYTNAEAYFMTMSKMVDAHRYLRQSMHHSGEFAEFYFDLKGAWVNEFCGIKNARVGHLFDEEDFFADAEDDAVFDGKAFGPVEALLGGAVMACIGRPDAFDLVDLPLERLCAERPELSPIYERMKREFSH